MIQNTKNHSENIVFNRLPKFREEKRGVTIGPRGLHREHLVESRDDFLLSIWFCEIFVHIISNSRTNGLQNLVDSILFPSQRTAPWSNPEIFSIWSSFSYLRLCGGKGCIFITFPHPICARTLKPHRLLFLHKATKFSLTSLMVVKLTVEAASFWSLSRLDRREEVWLLIWPKWRFSQSLRAVATFSIFCDSEFGKEQLGRSFQAVLTMCEHITSWSHIDSKRKGFFFLCLWGSKAFRPSQPAFSTMNFHHELRKGSWVRSGNFGLICCFGRGLLLTGWGLRVSAPKEWEDGGEEGFREGGNEGRDLGWTYLFCGNFFFIGEAFISGPKGKSWGSKSS